MSPSRAAAPRSETRGRRSNQALSAGAQATPDLVLGPPASLPWSP